MTKIHFRTVVSEGLSIKVPIVVDCSRSLLTNNMTESRRSRFGGCLLFAFRTEILFDELDLFQTQTTKTLLPVSKNKPKKKGR